jgi:hypothetical protein
MFFDAGQTQEAQGAVIPEKAPSSGGQNRNLSPQQFGKKGGGAAEGAEGAEAGAAGAEGAAGAAAGAGELAELAPLLLL